MPRPDLLRTRQKGKRIEIRNGYRTVAGANTNIPPAVFALRTGTSAGYTEAHAKAKELLETRMKTMKDFFADAVKANITSAYAVLPDNTRKECEVRIHGGHSIHVYFPENTVAIDIKDRRPPEQSPAHYKYYVEKATRYINTYTQAIIEVMQGSGIVTSTCVPDSTLKKLVAVAVRELRRDIRREAFIFAYNALRKQGFQQVAARKKHVTLERKTASGTKEVITLRRPTWGHPLLHLPVRKRAVPGSKRKVF